MTIKNALSYADAGVDIDAGNALVDAIKPAVKSTHRVGSNTQIGGFGGLFDLKKAGFKDPILVAANDGVGTKLKLAIDTNRHATIGIDLVAMCVNDLIVQGAEPLFFLDYFATGKLDVNQGISIIEGIAEGCRQAGAALIGGETAEMPGLYREGDYDLAGFAVGAAERDRMLPTSTLQSGDVVLGLASSGLHSNGFSLVRKVVELAGVNLSETSPFDPAKSWAETLLEPTRIYVNSVMNALHRDGSLKALAHITGGGFVENIPRILPNNLSVRLDLGTVKPHPIFKWLQGTGGIKMGEMLRTFNCGIGMVVVVGQREAAAMQKLFMESGETVYEIGRLEPRTDTAVNISCPPSL